MVDNVVLRQLDAALVDAANKRNEAQSGVNDLRNRRDEARRNLERAQQQEQNATEAARQASEEHRKLLDYYNGLADKTGLDSILARVETLAAAEREALRVLREARDIRMRCHSGLDQAQTDEAAAESALRQAADECQRISAEVNRAHNER